MKDWLGLPRQKIVAETRTLKKNAGGTASAEARSSPKPTEIQVVAEEKTSDSPLNPSANTKHANVRAQGNQHQNMIRRNRWMSRFIERLT